MGSQRSGVLELAVLGLLHETPMHGYELRKRLNSVLGTFRAFGYGSLYPCLKELLRQGLIEETLPGTVKSLAGRRSKIPSCRRFGRGWGTRFRSSACTRPWSRSRKRRTDVSCQRPARRVSIPSAFNADAIAAVEIESG